MAVPEAAVHEDDLSAARERDVRFAWQVFGMKLVSIPESVEHLAQRDFRTRVLVFDGPHDLGPLGSGHSIGHRRTP